MNTRLAYEVRKQQEGEGCLPSESRCQGLSSSSRAKLSFLLQAIGPGLLWNSGGRAPQPLSCPSWQLSSPCLPSSQVLLLLLGGGKNDSPGKMSPSQLGWVWVAQKPPVTLFTQPLQNTWLTLDTIPPRGSSRTSGPLSLQEAWTGWSEPLSSTLGRMTKGHTPLTALPPLRTSEGCL